MLPDHHGDRADQNTGQCAVAGHVFPDHRNQHHRTECSTETGPGIGHQAQYAVFRVGSQRDSNQGYQQHHGTTDPDQLQLRSGFAQEGFIEVFGQGARAHQQLAAQGAHHRRQNGRQQYTGNPWVEEDFRQFDEHALRVLGHRTGDFRVRREIGDTEEAHRNGAAQAQDHPGHGNATCLGDRLHRIRRHETREDVRLAEVAQTPAHQRDDADEGGAFEHVEVAWILRFDGEERGVNAACGQQDDDRRKDQREDHQRGLDGVGPAHREETADEGVGNRRRSTGPQRRFVGHAERAFEQTGTGDDAGSAVDGKEHQNHDRRDDPQQAAFIFETAGKVIRQSQGIAVVLGLHTQTAGDKQPVQVGTDDQADGDPAFGQTGHVDGARQAHQQPAAHVGGTGRQRGDDAAEAATTENIVGKVVGGAIGHQADQHHCCDVDHECDQGWIAYAH